MYNASFGANLLVDVQDLTLTHWAGFKLLVKCGSLTNF